MSKKRPVEERPAPVPTEARLACAALGVAVLAVYVLTLFPTIPPGDSGEFISVAAATGVAHPSGYPAFTLLSLAFAKLPFGGFAWRINLLSAVAGAGAAVFVFLTVYRLSRDRWAALLAMGLFAFSPLVWRYAVVAEVFSLNNLFAAAFLYLLVRFLEEPALRSWYALVFCLALGLTNHHTLGLVGFPVLIVCAVTQRALLLRPRPLLASLAIGLAAQLPYLYLPLAASQLPVVSWGDPTTWDGFLTHVLRREYGTLRLAVGESDTGFARAVWEYLIAVPRETLFAGVPLALFGLFASERGSLTRRFNRAALVGFFAYMVIFNGLANLSLSVPLLYDVFTRFWQLPNLFVFVWIGLGAHALARRLPHAAWAALLLVPLQLGLNWADEDQSDNQLFRDKALSILESLPPGALFLSAGDINTNGVRYLQQAENIRTDVTVVDLQMLRTPWYRRTVAKHYPDVRLPAGSYGPREAPSTYSLLELLRANQSRPLYTAFSSSIQQDESWRDGFDAWPVGFVEWMVPRDRPVSLDDYIAETGLDQLAMRPDGFGRVRRDSWDWTVERDYWEVEHRRIRKVLSHVMAEGIRPDLVDWARDRLELLIRENPDALPGVYRTLGVAYGELATRDPAFTAKQVEAWEHYLRMDRTGVHDPQLKQIAEFVREHRAD